MLTTSQLSPPATPQVSWPDDYSRFGGSPEVWREPAYTVAAGIPDILIVQPDPVLQAAWYEALRQQYRVVTASTAHEGLALLRVQPCRLLLLDLLPSAQGAELLRLVEQQPELRPTAVLVGAGPNQDSAALDALAAGADDSLSRTLDVRDLSRRVGLWLRGGRPPGDGNGREWTGLEIHSLGRFSVAHQGEVCLAECVKSRKAGALFKFLLTRHESVVPAATLYDLLWPHVTESVAEVDLRSMLHQLRKLLHASAQGPWPIEHRGTGLRLTLSSNDWWDLQDFSAWLLQGARLRRMGAIDQAVVAYQAGIGLYHGDFLGDESLDDRAEAMRTYLHEEWRAGLEALAALHGDLGEHAEQERLLRLVLRADPFREESYRTLMSLLAEHGRTAEALLLYRELREILRMELDTGPDPQTQTLAALIRQPV